MSSQAQKRKHKTLTIKEKYDILERLDRNESMKSLASEYGVGRSTLYDIQKNQEKIRSFVYTTHSDLDKRKTLKKAEYPEVEEALHQWLLQEKERHAHISGPMLAAKAKSFYTEITKKDDFTASSGWLDRFKTRYGLRSTAQNTEDTEYSEEERACIKEERVCIKEERVCSVEESLSNVVTYIEPFELRFITKVMDLNLSPSQVYNADEAGLFWRAIPSKTLPERKVCEERVTILPCANAAGTHALKMVVVGKSNKPRSFQNIDLPAHYYGRKNACMTKDLFKKWFHECFVPEVREWLKDHNFPERALLLLDEAPGHPSEEELTTEDKCITTLFLPPYCTALIQPIAQFVKQDYKKNLLVSAASKNQPLEKTLRETDMKDMVFALCKSWNELPPSTFASSWKNLWPDALLGTSSNDLPRNVTLEVIEQVASGTQISREDLETWCCGMDERENFFGEMPDGAVSDSTSTDEEDDEDVIASTPPVTAQDAIRAFELGLKWAEENGAPCRDLLLLRRLRDQALVTSFNRFNDIKPKIEDYFHASRIV